MTGAMIIAQELLACLEAALLAGPNPPPTSRIMLRAGAEVTPLLSTNDDECCSGLGWVRIVRTEPVRGVGDPFNVSCFTQDRNLVLEMGVARCAPTSPATSFPTEEEWTAVALQLDADHGAMESALCCAFTDLEGSAAEEVSAGAYEPFGVDGNCIGGTLQVTVRYTACC